MVKYGFKEYLNRLSLSWDSHLLVPNSDIFHALCAYFHFRSKELISTLQEYKDEFTKGEFLAHICIQ